MNFRSHSLARLLAPMCAALAFAAPLAHAAYPDRVIRLVVPTAPGTPIDIVSRIVSNRMAKELGQTIVVDNKAGASGILGGQDVLRNPADGYTLMTVFMPMTVAPSLLHKVPFDLRKDFVPIGQTAWSYNVLVTNTSVPAHSVAELVQLLKSRPGKMSYATGGIGTPAQMTAELFKLETKTFAVHVPYNQFGQAITGLVGGTHEFMFAASAAVVPFIDDGRLRALAVTGARRMPVLPKVPTLVELGYKDMVVRDWQGFVAKAGTPPAIVARLNAAITVALADEQVKAALAKLGVDPAGGRPEQLGTLIDTELTRWAGVVKQQGLKPD